MQITDLFASTELGVLVARPTLGEQSEPMLTRRIRHLYLDPLSALWIAIAERFGLAVERSEEVYASSDGEGTLYLGDDASLDADDSLAQMIFHELCHSLIQGEAMLSEPDWGLFNTDDRDHARELACIRLQAILSGEYGLREFFAPTTDFRIAYDAFPSDPREDAGELLPLIDAGYERASRAPWHPHLRAGLEATAQILDVLDELGALEAGGTPEQPNLASTYRRRDQRRDQSRR